MLVEVQDIVLWVSVFVECDCVLVCVGLWFTSVLTLPALFGFLIFLLSLYLTSAESNVAVLIKLDPSCCAGGDLVSLRSKAVFCKAAASNQDQL